MDVKRLSLIMIAIWMLPFVGGTELTQAQQVPPMSEIFLTDPAVSSFYPDFSMSFGVRRYINSFTSYQFPDPQQPALNPLSRLEWPWEQTFGTVGLMIRQPYLTVKLEGAATWSVYSNLKAQDSDWEDSNNPNQKTIFSDAQSKPRCWTFDASVSAPLPLYSAIRGVIGYRAQQFSFTYTDILQRNIFDSQTGQYIPIAITFDPGAAIEFSQYYKHYYVGGAVSFMCDPGGIKPELSGFPVLVTIQADCGYVTGKNEDYHLLRTPGPRYTWEYTTGNSGHVNLAAEMSMGSRFLLKVAGDYMRIRTDGRHELSEPGLMEKWGGAEVWSEQKYIEASAGFKF
jgi:hypothetical protein